MSAAKHSAVQGRGLNGEAGPRARYKGKPHKWEVAKRVREALGGLEPEELEDFDECKRTISKLGFKLSDATIRGHMKWVRVRNSLGIGGAGTPEAVGVGLVDQIAAAARAIKACGSIDGLKQVLAIIERMKGL